MLRQGAEIRIVTPITGGLGSPGDGVRACVIVTHEGELVEKLTNGVAEVFSPSGTGPDIGQRLTQTPGVRGV